MTRNAGKVMEGTSYICIVKWSIFVLKLGRRIAATVVGYEDGILCSMVAWPCYFLQMYFSARCCATGGTYIASLSKYQAH